MNDRTSPRGAGFRPNTCDESGTPSARSSAARFSPESRTVKSTIMQPLIGMFRSLKQTLSPSKKTSFESMLLNPPRQSRIELPTPERGVYEMHGRNTYGRSFHRCWKQVFVTLLGKVQMDILL